MKIKNKYGGLKNTNDIFYFSTISLLDRTLSEEEFIASSLLFDEKNSFEQKKAFTAFSNFFEKYIFLCKEKTCIDYEYSSLNVIYDLNTHLTDFLFENREVHYIDLENNYLFTTEPYLEIHVYSTKKFILDNIDDLHLRIDNQMINWRDHWS